VTTRSARTPFERVAADEWLDADLGDPAEVTSALRSLRWVNRLFGGNRMHRRLLQGAVAGMPKGRDLHIMEVAAGRADVLRAALKHLSWPKAHLQITLLDRSADHLPSADDEWPVPIKHLAADALRIPLPDHSVDIILNCLFLHHLSEEQVGVYLREALRVARVAVVVNDLERSWLHYRLAKLMSLVDPSRLSKHDGPVSVRQAYTCEELRAFAAETGHRFEIHRGYLLRLGLILWK
jgi:hypothetical protein